MKITIDINKVASHELLILLVREIKNPRQLAKLAKSQNAIVRREVARNYCTPLKVLKVLSQDKEANVRKFANDRLKFCNAQKGKKL